MENIETILLVLWIVLGLLLIFLLVMVILMFKVHNSKPKIEKKPLIEKDLVSAPEPIEIQPETIEKDNLKLNQSSTEHERRKKQLQEIDKFTDINKSKYQVEREIKELEEAAKKKLQNVKEARRNLKHSIPLDMDLENTSVALSKINYRDNSSQEMLNPIIKDIKPTIKKEEKNQEQQKVDSNTQIEEIEIIDL